MFCCSHELYTYANTLDMHTNFAPQLKGRYLSSNANITVPDKHGKPISVPVGGKPSFCPKSEVLTLFLVPRTLCEIQDTEVSSIRIPW